MLNSSVREALVIVRDMHLAAREVPDQPGIDGAEQQLAVPCAFPRAGHVIENPFNLVAEKIASTTRPVVSLMQGSRLRAFKSSQMLAVRRIARRWAY